MNYVKTTCLLIFGALNALNAGTASVTGVGNDVFSIVENLGVPRVAVNGVPVPGMCALPQPRLGPEAVTFSMKDFYGLGVRFFSDIWWAKTRVNDWWLGEGRYDFAAFDRRMKGLLDAAPDGWIFPRIKMDPPEWWSKAHPEEMRANEARPDSEKWRALYRRMLEDVVRHVESSPYADRIMGYHLGALHGSEWLVYPWPKEEAPPVEWDILDPLPPLEVSAERRAYAAKRNKDIADSLLYAAAIVKKLTARRKLVGAFFGYMNNSDHQDFYRVVSSPDVDFFSSPGSYEHRRGGQSGRFQAPWMSTYRLHGKLYWDEADLRTYHSKQKVAYRCRTAEESVGAIKRNLGYALTGGWETWWFLIAGNNTFHDEEMLAPIRRALVEEKRVFFTAKWKPADVAVFTSATEYSTSRLCAGKDKRVRIPCKAGFHYTTMPFAGVAYDSYVLDDICDRRLPDYRVYVFPNAFTLTGEQRAAIKRLVRRPGKTAVWLYAPGYYRDGKGSASNVEDLTGVRVTERYPVKEAGISRMFEAENGGVAENDGWRSVLLTLPPDITRLRQVFRDAGVHRWVDTPEVVAAGRGYLMVHAASDGKKNICLPSRCDVTEIYGTSAPFPDVTSFEDFFRKGETKIYRLTEGPSARHSPSDEAG